MNRQVPIDRNESNPMLSGLLELVKEDNQALKETQQELNKAMNEDATIAGIMEQHKKERAELQTGHQKKISEMMKANSEIAALQEQHRKELAEMQTRQRQAIEKAMMEDAAIVEEMKTQKDELNALVLSQQKAINQEVNANQAVAGVLSNVKNARQELQERQKMFDQEVFKATYMTPVMVTPEPTKDEEGNSVVAEGSKVAIQILPMKNGKGLMMAFTDSKEFKKWTKAEESHTLSMKMQDFIAAVLKDANIAGVSINPFSDNIVIPRERMEMMVKAAASQKQAAMAKNVEVVEADI